MKGPEGRKAGMGKVEAPNYGKESEEGKSDLKAAQKKKKRVAGRPGLQIETGKN